MPSLFLRGLLCAVLLLSTASCDEAVAPTTDRFESLPPGVHVLLFSEELSTGRMDMDLHVRRVEVRDTLMGVQGEIRFNPEALALDSIRVIAGVLGATREIEPGRIRYALAALTGIPEGPLINASFVVLGAQEGFGATALIERLVAGAQFEDVTSLSAGARP